MKRMKSFADRWYVEIVRAETNEVVKQMGPMTKRKAEKVDDGANNNLDHTRFFTRISEVSE